MPETKESRVTLSLSSAEALVFFAWLQRFNSTKQVFDDQAEERVLWDMEAELERALPEPFRADYEELLKRAREQVRDIFE